MRGDRTALLLATTFLAACAGNPDHTLAELRDLEPDVRDVRVADSLDRAMLGYRKFLEEAPESALTPEAMRRLADLKLEKEYGILGDGKLEELPAPEASAPRTAAHTGSSERPRVAGVADHLESEAAFERRATRDSGMAQSSESFAPPLPGGKTAASTAPLEAIELYDQILNVYPAYPHNDQVLYQKARAYDELGRNDEAIVVLEQLIAEYPHSRHIDEAQFRRAEYYFTRRKYLDAEDAYSSITKMGVGSEYYELALYKLGWTFYKQELHEEALREYVALLDYKVSTGYDFDQSRDEADERRIADTFRVISLSFSNLGGPEAVQGYFAENGHRSYEDRIYSHLGEFYLEKLRYQDAAASYKAFVDLHPLHESSPHFSMRVVEIYEAGGFPKLVLESKKEFAATYGLTSEYWRHFDVDDSPEVVRYLKANLGDLANHYHALYQQPDLADEQPANFQEALRWYRAFLGSFPEDPETPAVHYRLADLLLEHRDFGEAAREYEHTAYDYPPHEQAAAAGYAAIFARRESEKLALGPERESATRAAVASTFRFVERFPEDEHAAVVMSAAVDDLYDMKEFALAIQRGRELIDRYPEAEVPIRRSAWTVVGHACFEIGAFEPAEDAYLRVLEMTPTEDDSRQARIDNLAAAIYKQGEQANLAGDYRLAAHHFLRIREAAPSSSIRPAAEYDAGAALIRLEDWAAATTVLEAFRDSYPDHELNQEATRQLALVRRRQGDLSGAAREYERVAGKAEEPELRREALLAAGELYEKSADKERALAVYGRYVARFPEPLELAVETRFKMAEMYASTHDEAAYREQLKKIVAVDAAAAGERTPRIRYLAARAALVFSEDLYHRFDEVKLVQPFERNLREKQRRMNAALEAFGKLVDYEVGEVTAAATYYMAEIYFDFSRSLLDSERPTGLGPAEKQDYEMALEEEAFPFEEKAIDVHEKNLELMAAGVYNAWIERSLAKLAERMPGRYAKSEESSGFLASIDSYVYRAPNAPPATAKGGVAEAAPDATVAEDPDRLEAAAPAAGAVPASVAAERVAQPSFDSEPEPDRQEEEAAVPAGVGDAIR